MKPYRYAVLTDEQKKDLEKRLKKAPLHHLRQKYQAVLLSHRRYRIDQLAAILGRCEKTIRNWLNTWQNEGIDGFQIAPGRGRPAVLDKIGLTVGEEIKKK